MFNRIVIRQYDIVSDFFSSQSVLIDFSEAFTDTPKGELLTYDKNTLYVKGSEKNVVIDCVGLADKFDVHQIEIDNPNAIVGIILDENAVKQLNQISVNARTLILASNAALNEKPINLIFPHSLMINCPNGDVIFSTNMKLEIPFDLIIGCLTVENETQIVAGRDAVLNLNEIIMPDSAGFRAINSIRINNAHSITKMRGEITTPGRLYLSAKENIHLCGAGRLHGEQSMAISAKNMMLSDDAELVSNHHMIVIDESFKTDEWTTIKSEADEGLVLLEWPEQKPLDQNYLKLLSQEYPNSALLIKNKLHDPKTEAELKDLCHGSSRAANLLKPYLVETEVYYAYRYFAKDNEVLTKIKKIPDAMHKLTFPAEAQLYDFTKMDPYIKHCLRAHRVYQSKLMLCVGGESQMDGDCFLDEVLVKNATQRHGRTARLQGGLRAFFCTQHYWNGGKVEWDLNCGMLEIRADRSAVNGISELKELARMPLKPLFLSPFSKKHRASHQASIIKIVSPLAVETLAHREALFQKVISLGRFNALNLKNARNERNTQLFHLEIADVPDIAGIFTNLDEMMNRFSVGDFSSFTKGLTLETVGIFFLFIISRIIPVLGPWMTVTYNLARLWRDGTGFYSSCLALYQKYKKNETITIADILETLEPLLDALQPAVMTAMQVDQMRYSEITNLEEINGTDDALIKLKKTHHNAEIFNHLVAVNNPFTTWSGSLSLMGDIGTLALYSSSNSSICSIDLLSIVPGTKIDSSIAQFSVGFDCAVNSNISALLEKSIGMTCARHLSIMAIILDLQQTTLFAEDASFQAKEFNINETTKLTATSTSLKVPHLPLQDYLRQQGKFTHFSSLNKDVATDDPVDFETPFESSGTIRISTQSEEGITVNNSVDAATLDLSAQRGDVHVNASLTAKQALSVSGINVAVLHTNMNADKTSITAVKDVDVKAASVNGVTETEVNARQNIRNFREMHLHPNPLGGTKATWDESSITSSDGKLTEYACQRIETNGKNAGRYQTNLTGEEGFDARASTHPCVSSHHTERSCLGLKRDEIEVIDKQISRPTIGSPEGKASLNAPRGDITTQGADFPGDVKFNAVHTLNEPLIVQARTIHHTTVAGGFLYDATTEQIDERSVMTVFYVPGETQFQSRVTILFDVILFGPGLLKMSGESAEIRSSTLEHSTKRKVRGFSFGIDTPLRAAIENVADDVNALLASEQVSEVLVNGVTTAVDTAMTGAEILKTAKALQQGIASESSREILKALPIIATLSYHSQTTETHTQTASNSYIHVHQLEVREAKKFNTEAPITADEGYFQTPVLELAGKELKNSVDSEQWGVGVNFSFRGIEGAEAQYGRGHAESTTHTMNSSHFDKLSLDVQDMTLDNAQLSAKELSGSVGHLTMHSAPDTTESHQWNAALSTNGAGFQENSLHSSSTVKSGLQAEHAANFAVKTLSLAGAEFKASGAKIEEKMDTTVNDFYHEQSVGASLNVAAFFNSSENSSVPVRGQFHEKTLAQQISSQGNSVTEEHQHGFRVAIPLIQNRPTNNPSTLAAEAVEESVKVDSADIQSEDSSSSLSNPESASQFEEKQNPLEIKSTEQLPIKQAMDSLMDAEFSTLSTIVQGYDALTPYGLALARGSANATFDAVESPLSFAEDTLALSIHTIAEYSPENSLATMMDSLIDLDTVRYRMSQRKENFYDFIGNVQTALEIAESHDLWKMTQPLLNMALHFSQQSGEKTVEELSYLGTSILLNTALMKGGGLVKNYYDYGVFVKPPLFLTEDYLTAMEDLASGFPPFQPNYRIGQLNSSLIKTWANESSNHSHTFFASPATENKQEYKGDDSLPNLLNAGKGAVEHGSKSIAKYFLPSSLTGQALVGSKYLAHSEKLLLFGLKGIGAAGVGIEVLESLGEVSEAYHLGRDVKHEIVAQGFRIPAAVACGIKTAEATMPRCLALPIATVPCLVASSAATAASVFFCSKAGKNLGSMVYNNYQNTLRYGKK